MTLLYSSTVFLEHETGMHPEQPDRIRSIRRRLASSDLPSRCRQFGTDAEPIVPVTAERLRRVHTPAYIAFVERFVAEQGGLIERDTVVSNHSYEVALQAAGAVCDATARVLRGEDRNALCLVRPPGHHALVEAPMGFCLFNSVAAAARVATQEFQLERVLIVDWDVHHGNGTQAIFWEDPAVAFFSSHRFPFYPGTGTAEETGAGPGQGTTRNVPFRFGVSRREFLSRFRTELETFADRMKPQLILLSAGFDAHHQDPIGSLGLEAEDFQTLSQTVQAIADTHAAGRIISALEGGYHLDALADCVEIHLRELVSASPPRS